MCYYLGDLSRVDVPAESVQPTHQPTQAQPAVTISAYSNYTCTVPVAK